MEGHFWSKLLCFIIGSFFIGQSAWASNVQPTVIFSEVAWMGNLDSSSNEWLELANPGTETVDLTGWQITTASGSLKISLSGQIAGGSFLLLERTDDQSVPDMAADQIYSGSLSNSGDVLRLADQNGQFIDLIEANAGWPAGDNATKQTMQKNDTNWVTAAPSPKAAIDLATVIIPDENVAEISSSIEETSSSAEENTTTENKLKRESKPKIIINEIFPNPVGDDRREEFIELKNIGATEANLLNWRLRDGLKNFFIITTSTLATTTLAGGEYLAIYRQKSGLVLANNQANIKLYDANDKLVDSVKCNNPPEGAAWALNIINEWQATINPTPSKENKIQPPPGAPVISLWINNEEPLAGELINFDASDSFNLENIHNEPIFFWEFGDGETARGPNVLHAYAKSETYSLKLEACSASGFCAEKIQKIKVGGPADKAASLVSVKNKTIKIKASTQKIINQSLILGLLNVQTAKQKKIGTRLKVQGQVSVAPGVIGSQYFYLQDDTGGLQIYSYKKDFPQLAIGDLVEVTGELAKSGNELRLKTKTALDIIVLTDSSELEALSPRGSLTLADLSDQEQSLVKISGTILDVAKNSLKLAAEDGEIGIVLKTGAKINARMAEGDRAAITGILSPAKNGWQLVPRGQSDLQLIKPTELISPKNPEKSSFSWLAVTPILFFPVFLVWRKFSKKKNSLKAGLPK